MAAFIAKAATAPPGSHVAKLDRAEPRESKYGKRSSESIAWVFKLIDGEHAGKELVKLTGTELRLGTAFGDLVSALYGRAIKEGQSVDPVADCVGRRYQIFAEPGDDGIGAIIRKITLTPNDKE